jgi:hypothetical protein
MPFFKLLMVALLAVLLAACQPKPKPEQFAGKWKSSRLATPLLLHANGEWEIRGDDDRVLQYGVWQLKDRTFIWSVKLDGQLQHDPNAIVSMDGKRFELRERDGSVTRFDRLQ